MADGTMAIHRLPWVYARATLNSYSLYRDPELALQNAAKDTVTVAFLSGNVQLCKITDLSALGLTW